VPIHGEPILYPTAEEQIGPGLQYYAFLSVAQPGVRELLTNGSVTLKWWSISAMEKVPDHITEPRIYRKDLNMHFFPVVPT
jgi:hypothetical protein